MKNKNLLEESWVGMVLVCLLFVIIPLYSILAQANLQLKTVATTTPAISYQNTTCIETFGGSDGHIDSSTTTCNESFGGQS